MIKEWLINAKKLFNMPRNSMSIINELLTIIYYNDIRGTNFEECMRAYENEVKKRRSALKKEIATELSKAIAGNMNEKKFKKSKLFSILKQMPNLDLDELKISESPNSFIQNLAGMLGIKTKSKIHAEKFIEAIADNIVNSKVISENLNLEVRSSDNRHWYMKTINKNANNVDDRFSLYFRDSIIGLADFFVGGNTSKNAPYELFIQNWNAACAKENVSFFAVEYNTENEPEVQFKLGTNDMIKKLTNGKELSKKERKSVIEGIEKIRKGLNDIVYLKNEDLKLNTLSNFGDSTPKERIIKGLTTAAVCLLAAAVAFTVVLYGQVILYLPISATMVFSLIVGAFSLSIASASAAIYQVGSSIAAAFEKPYVGSENKEVFKNYKKAVDDITESIERFEKEFPKTPKKEIEDFDFEKVKSDIERVRDALKSAYAKVEDLEKSGGSSKMER